VDVVHFDTLADEVTEPVTGEEPEGTAEDESTGLDSAGLDPAAVDGAETDSAGVVWATGVVPPTGVSVTGQTVVRIGMVDVTTWVESAGQFVTVDAQLVMVISLVV
jgi:sugar lactone lactonase YvrE